MKMYFANWLVICARQLVLLANLLQSMASNYAPVDDKSAEEECVALLHPVSEQGSETSKLEGSTVGDTPGAHSAPALATSNEPRPKSDAKRLVEFFRVLLLLVTLHLYCSAFATVLALEGVAIYFGWLGKPYPEGLPPLPSHTKLAWGAICIAGYLWLTAVGKVCMQALAAVAYSFGLEVSLSNRRDGAREPRRSRGAKALFHSLTAGWMMGELPIWRYLPPLLALLYAMCILEPPFIYVAGFAVAPAFLLFPLAVAVFNSCCKRTGSSEVRKH
jgi:hypothetical protein